MSRFALKLPIQTSVNRRLVRMTTIPQGDEILDAKILSGFWEEEFNRMRWHRARAQEKS